MKKIIKYTLAIVLGLSLYSCDKLFDSLEGDLTRMSEEDMTSSQAGLEKLLSDVYSAIPMDAFINVDEEIKKLEADLAHQQGFLRGVMAKLSNERFVQNAKPEIVALEQKKKADAEARIAALEEAIKALKG